MNPKVSVIIPVYNSSKYIARCCHSLFGQTFDSLQYIFVDDGSDDGSLDVIKEILSEYPNRLPQVSFLIHDENKGVGAARQYGLAESRGEYVTHCDSDDWVESDAYRILYEKAISEDADIVTCAYCIDSEDGTTIKTVPSIQNDSKELSFDIGPRTGSLVLKLIRRDLILNNNLQVPRKLKWGEDFCLSLESLLLSRKTVCVNLPLYHYVQHKDSLTHTLTTEKCLSLINCGHVIESFLKQHNLSSNYVYQLNWLKFQLKQYLLVFPQTRDIQLWKSHYPECHQDILSYPSASYLKLSAWLIVHHMTPVARFVLQSRDLISSYKNR